MKCQTHKNICFSFSRNELLKYSVIQMIVGVLTTCQTQHT